MNFELNEEHKLLKEMMREFAEKEILPQSKILENNEEFPHDLLQKLASLGILSMTVPPEYQGTKTDYLSLMLVIEEIARVSPALAVIISVHCSLFCYSILKFGTEEQKKNYLPKAASGKILGAFSLSEPGAGSDALGIETHAVKDGSTYIINGTKAWVTGGKEAGAIILFAKTSKQSEKKKISAFIIDKDTPGIHVSKIENKMGLRSSHTTDLVLENCRIQENQLLGQEGQGAKIAFQCLDSSRIGISAQSVGIAQRALEEAVLYAKQREAFNQKISEFQAIQFMLADISTLTEAARLMTYKAAFLHDQGRLFTKEAAMAKLFASEAANKIVYNALQVHGGYGYSKEFFIEQLYRDARVLPIYEGTSEIQRLVISRCLLREP